MSVIDSIRNKVGEWKANAEEKARFRKFVEKQTLPIRRKAFLEEKKRLAVQEGKRIADKSIPKPEEEGKEYNFMSAKPTMDWGFDFDKEFNKKEDKKNGK